MFLPTKSVHPQECLLTIGYHVMSMLDEPQHPDWLWEEYQRRQPEERWVNITFDWFVLALDALYAIGLLRLEDDGKLVLLRVS